MSVESTSTRAPDFFIVGHHKSGTTALYEMLRRHPQIYMPDMKEPEFFGRESFRRADAPPISVRRPRTYAESRPQTYAEYLSLFEPARAGQRVGEASPSYLSSATAAGLIAEARPDARIVAILREPAAFLYSLHLQLLRNHVQHETDLGKAIANEGHAHGSTRPLDYTGRVRYVEQLRRYREAFAPEQLLVLIYDDFRADNRATIRTVLRFLDVDPEIEIEAVEANPTIAARSPRLERWVRTLRSGRGPVSGRVKSTLRALTPEQLRRGIVRTVQRNVVYASAPPPPESLMLELRRRFVGEVLALSAYLERDLVSLWGYDSLREPDGPREPNGAEGDL